MLGHLKDGIVKHAPVSFRYGVCKGGRHFTDPLHPLLRAS